jgi:methyl-accepting chemotaxis protein
MPLIRNLTIRGKIISVLLLVISLELAVAVSGLYFMGSVNRNLSRIVEVDAQKLKIAGDIRTNLLQIHRAEKNLIISSTKQQIDRYRNNIAQYSAELRESLGRMDALADSDARPLIKNLKVHLEEFLRVNREIESLVLSPAVLSTSPSAEAPLNTRAIELSIGSGRVAYNDAAGVLDELIERMDNSLNASRIAGQQHFNRAIMVMIILSVGSIVVGLFVGLLVADSIASNLRALVGVTDAIAGGELETAVEVSSRDEAGDLASSIREMQAALLRAKDEATARDWLKTGINRINEVMRGRIGVNDLCTHVISEMATYLGAHVGAVFMLDGEQNEPVLELAAGYAYTSQSGFPFRFRQGEGLVGQAALEKRQIVAQEVPRDYIKICSGLGEGCPSCITVTPLLYEERVEGVAELGFFTAPTDLQLEYLNQIIPAVAINIETVLGREGLAKALARAQALTEELQQQQEELQAANEELEEQTMRLLQSEEKLKIQQEELETANQELEEKNEYLERQKRLIEQANEELERRGLEV